MLLRQRRRLNLRVRVVRVVAGVEVGTAVGADGIELEKEDKKFQCHFSIGLFEIN